MKFLLVSRPVADVEIIDSLTASKLKDREM